MPKLFQETKTVQLETQPEISITMKIGMTMGQNMVLQKKYPQMTDSTSPDAISAGVEMITMSIIDRNIEDDN
jgi:hypothetical protein